MISIIIPNYNKGKYVLETLESIGQQTSEEWEAIVVDDGSTDNSLEVVEKFTKTDARFRCVEMHMNVGGSKCRNIGLSQARFPYVMFLDSDDLLDEKCIEKRAAFVQNNPGLDFAVFTMGIFREKQGDMEDTWIPDTNEPLRDFLAHKLPWSVMQPLWKKEFILGLNGFNESYERMQDVELHTRALLSSNQYKTLCGDPDCFYRVTPERFVMNQSDYIRRFLSSAVRYYKEFYTDSRRAPLQSTIIEAVSNCFQSKLEANMTNEEYNSLIYDSGVFQLPKIKRVTRWYIHATVALSRHIRGMKFIAKTMTS